MINDDMLLQTWYCLAVLCCLLCVGVKKIERVDNTEMRACKA